MNADNKYRINIAENSTVLIVDDIPENLQVLGNILMSNGLDVGFATNGQQALEAIDYKKPDIILLDIMMPGMDGYQVCQILKESEINRDIPIIFLTAKTQTDDIVKGFDVGAVDYVTKPFNASELVSRVFTQLEIKKSRDIINEQNQKLSELNASKDKFFSIISHDLKSPYSGLLGLTSLIINEKDSLNIEEIVDLVRKLNTSLKNQYSMIENLLHWARIQTNRLEIHKEKIDITHLINEVIAIQRNVSDKKNLKVINNIKAKIYCYADRFMIQSVLNNLISNAIKFSHYDTEIHVSADVEDNLVFISIKDFGLGIKPDNLNKLFRIDSHITTLGTDNEKGTGLGLILCKEIIERNGGTISVFSVLNEGSTFTVSLDHYIEN